MSKREQMGPHVVKMISYTKRLTLLGMVMDNDLVIGFILHSLLDSYRIFITTYLMSEKEKFLSKLLGFFEDSLRF